MPKRATKRPSKVFASVLKQARKRLAIDANRAEAFQHRGLRGDERALALADFLSDRLPDAFAVGSGEAIDFADNRIGELDIIIYDRLSAAPIQDSGSTVLVPAETIYAVIEVKSVLSKAETEKCLNAAKKIRALRPFKQRFLSARENGLDHKHLYRCPYYVFAYKSDLSAIDWEQKEYDRLATLANDKSYDLDLIDRIFVMDRGFIIPQTRFAIRDDDSKDTFLEFYINLMNFLSRERARRPAIDWMAYASRQGSWKRLKSLR